MYLTLFGHWLSIECQDYKWLEWGGRDVRTGGKYEREIQTIVSLTFSDANEQYLKPVGISWVSSFLIGPVTPCQKPWLTFIWKQRSYLSLYGAVDNVNIQKPKIFPGCLFPFFSFKMGGSNNFTSGLACLRDKMQLVSDFSHSLQFRVTLNSRLLLVNIINTLLSLVDTLSPLSLSVTASMCSAQILHDLNNSPQLYLRTTHIFVCLHFF